jgi:hypothetical protein
MKKQKEKLPRVEGSNLDPPAMIKGMISDLDRKITSVVASAMTNID